mgnify:CR=1 FL=1
MHVSLKERTASSVRTYFEKTNRPEIKKFLPQKAKTVEEAKNLLSDEKAELFEKWLTMKSEKTISDFLKLGEEEKESVLDFLDEFAVFEEVECKGKKFILCHSGIDNFEDRDLYEHEDEDFIFAKTDYNKIYFPDAYLVTGHTPTVALGKEFAGKVYAKKRHLALDCGAAFGGRLAAVCLDTLKVYYC